MTAERLREHSECFDRLLDAIPARFYYQETENLPFQKAKKIKKNQEASADQQRKENTKKGKIAKLDPENSKTILDIQAERASAKPKKTASIADLKERLHAEIADLAKQRHASEEDAGKGSNQRKRKKAEKAAQKEEEGEDGEPKQRREQKKQKMQREKPSQQKDEAEDDDDGEDSQGSDGEEDIQFGRVLTKDESQSKFLNKPKRKVTKEKLLAKAEQFEEFIANADEEKRKEILEKKSWKDALAKATGTKVKDNATLLKKSIKREDKKKKKSQGVWKDRYAKVESEKQARQDKRNANIKAEKDKRKADQAAGRKKGTAGKKVKEAPQRPGFEGKKKGFLNPKKKK